MASSSSAAHAPGSAPPPPENLAHACREGTQLGFIGLGNMGSAMALNLSLALENASPPLPPLKVFNRSRGKADKLVEQAEEHRGAKGDGSPTVVVADSIAEVVQTCQIVFTSLKDDEALLQVYEEMCQASHDHSDHSGYSDHHTSTIWADTSTVYPDTTGQVERQVSALHHRTKFVATPAFGPPPVARARNLVFATGGNWHAKSLIAPFLCPAMGRKVMDFGGNQEVASRFKLLGNSFILGMIELLGETMTLADKTDVGAGRFYEFLQEMFPSQPTMTYGRKILESNFRGEDGFSLSGGLKDATLIRRLANSVDCPMNVVDAAHQHMISARANAPQGSDLDWSALVGGQRLTAGLDPWKGKRPGLLRD